VTHTATYSMRQLKPLTGLRLLAALLVVLYHFGPYVLRPLASDPLATLKIVERNIVLTGMIGVDLFFILSGFILAYTYLDARGRLRGTRGQFWVARIARIYPIYVCAWVVAALPFAWHHEPHDTPVLAAATSLTLTQAWLPWFPTDWNQPAWSLSNEALFYLLFPLLPVAVARLNRYHLYLAMGALWAISLAMPLAYLAAHPAGSLWSSMVFNPLFFLPEFLTGVALGRLYVLAQERGATSAVRRRIRPGTLAALALLGCAAVMVSLPWTFGPMYHVAAIPFFTLLIYSLVCGESRLASLLSSPAMVRLGEASYALYILHRPLWDWVTHVYPAPAPGDPARVPFFLAYLGLLIALSLLALRFLEQPARRAIRQALSGRARARPSVSEPGRIRPAALMKGDT
jgi:peptidoglycan/LPS O-acetylase OafA/YrhL